MKQTLLAGAVILAAGAAFAGGYSEPVVEPEVVMEDAVASAGSDEWVLAMLVILTIGLGITGQ